MKPTALGILRSDVFLIACVPAGAQQTTGTPGAPDATTTIDGNYLPPPPPRFGGTINMGGQGQQDTDLAEVSQRVLQAVVQPDSRLHCTSKASFGSKREIPG